MNVVWPSEGRNGGRYFPVDEAGYLANQLDDVPIQSGWQQLVETAVDKVTSLLDDVVDGVYLRGSVAEGRAWDFTSDVDFIVITTVPAARPVTEVISSLEAMHPIAREVVIDLVPLDDVRLAERFRFMQVVLKVQSRLLFGTDRRTEFPPVRAGWGMVFAAHSLDQRYERFCRMRRCVSDKTTRRLRTQAFFRAALRCGFELYEEELRRYTRDIDLCAAVISTADPARSALFESALQCALGDDHENEPEVAADFMSWFRQEYLTRAGRGEQR